MGRYRAVAALLCGVAACATGCVAPGGGAPEVQEPAAAEAAPPAFHFDSGDLVIGPFDPEQVKDNLFDPCAEISDAELAAAGLEKDSVQGDLEESDYLSIKYCATRAEDAYESAGLGVVPNKRDSMLRQVEPLDSYAVDGLPSAFVVPVARGREDTCIAAVETTRGTLGFLASSLRSDARLEEVCPKAVATLERLWVISQKSR